MNYLFKPKNPIFQIEDRVAPKFKVSDLVNYKYIEGENATPFMAIIDTVNDDNTYSIYVIDNDWNDNEPIHKVKEDRLTEIKLNQEYNPDLVFNTSNDNKNKNKIKQMVQFKQSIKALQANIDFINANANKENFSDFAIGPKIEALKELRSKLDNLYKQENVLEVNTYESYENLLYGNIKTKISAICDANGIDVNTKEQIMTQFIETFDILLGFGGLSMTLDLVYYKLYGYSAIINLYTMLPESIKEKILLLLYEVIKYNADFLLNCCSDPFGTLTKIGGFLSLFKNNLFYINKPILLPGRTQDINDDDDINTPKNRKRKFSFDNDHDIDEFISMSQKECSYDNMCATIQSEINVEDQQNKINFDWLHNGNILQLTDQEIDVITKIYNQQFPIQNTNTKYSLGGKRNKKTRKINKKRRLVRKTKKASKSYKKNKKHNTKKRNTKRR
jgi:hypothetical protein